MLAELRLAWRDVFEKKGPTAVISVVAQRKAGILPRWRKENEIFTQEYGKIYNITVCRD